MSSGMFKVYSVWTDCEGCNKKPQTETYTSTLEEAISYCLDTDKNCKQSYTYMGSFVNKLESGSKEETEVYSSPFRVETERRIKEELDQWLERSAERDALWAEEDRKKKTRREKLLESWGITEDDVYLRNVAKEVENGIYKGELKLRQDSLKEAKKNLANLLFNYEKLIEEAKMKVEEESEKLNKVLDSPTLYEKAIYNNSTKEWETKTFGVNDIGSLWTRAGGKDKWEKINLKKMGPLPVRE